MKSSFAVLLILIFGQYGAHFPVPPEHIRACLGGDVNFRTNTSKRLNYDCAGKQSSSDQPTSKTSLDNISMLNATTNEEPDAPTKKTSSPIPGTYNVTTTTGQYQPEKEDSTIMKISIILTVAVIVLGVLFCYVRKYVRQRRLAQKNPGEDLGELGQQPGDPFLLREVECVQDSKTCERKEEEGADEPDDDKEKYNVLADKNKVVSGLE